MGKDRPRGARYRRLQSRAKALCFLGVFAARGSDTLSKRIVPRTLPFQATKEFVVAKKTKSSKKKKTKKTAAAAAKKRAKKAVAKKAKRAAKKARKPAKKPAAKKAATKVAKKSAKKAIAKAKPATAPAPAAARGNIYYITTAIAYPSGLPHIGHAYEAIATDALARF